MCCKVSTIVIVRCKIYPWEHYCNVTSTKNYYLLSRWGFFSRTRLRWRLQNIRKAFIGRRACPFFGDESSSDSMVTAHCKEKNKQNYKPCISLEKDKFYQVFLPWNMVTNEVCFSANIHQSLDHQTETFWYNYMLTFLSTLKLVNEHTYMNYSMLANISHIGVPIWNSLSRTDRFLL